MATEVDAAHFSPNGDRIVTASHDKSARVWETKSGEPVTGPLMHDGPVWSARFSPDGNKVVTASFDETARMWDARSGNPLIDPLKHGDRVVSAEFSPDGKRIVTSSRDKAARVWDVSSPGKPAPDWLPRLAEAVSGQHLNDRGVFEPSTEDTTAVLEQIREELNRAPAVDAWAGWGRWFLAERSTRTISPYSKLTVQEYIENRINEKEPNSLEEAERLAAGNPALLARIAAERKELKANNKNAFPAISGRYSLPDYLNRGIAKYKEVSLTMLSRNIPVP